jgi:apolipoprotein N-acyltransferase
MSKGVHTITLKVTADVSGTTTIQIFQVSVEANEEETTPFSTLWEQIALMLIVAFVALALLMQRGRRRR